MNKIRIGHIKGEPGASVKPEFANTTDECVDITKLYVLPDGYVYNYADGKWNNTGHLFIDTKDYVKPQMFGAKGDGVTDDTEAIQNTINNNKVVFIPEGKYLISRTIEIPSDRYIFGGGATQSVKALAEFCTTENICMIKFTGHRSKLSNILLSHSTDNTSNIVELGNCRYITLNNVGLYHGTTHCDGVGVDITNDEGDWSGYITLESVYASGYRICLNAHSTLLRAYNCVFNGGSDTLKNLSLSGETFSFNGCDLSGEGVAVSYDGAYPISFTGCYFEGFYVDSAFDVSHKDATIRIDGCKIHQGKLANSYGEKSTYFLFTNKFDLRNILNFMDGTHSTKNMVINPNFKHGALGWVYAGCNLTTDTSGSANRFTTSIRAEGSLATYSMYHSLGKLGEGTYTIGLWLNDSGESDDVPDHDIYVQDTNNKHNYVFRARRKVYIDGWALLLGVFTIPESQKDNEWEIAIYCTNGSVSSYTGVGLYKGIYYECPSDYEMNSKFPIVDKIAIKGSDGKYYKLVVGADGALTTEQM